MTEGIVGIIISVITAIGGWEAIKYLINRKAEKRIKETEAKTAEVDMAQKVQDTYEKILEAKDKEVTDNHRIIEELRTDRDHYKNLFDKLEVEVRDMKKSYEQKEIETDRKIARLGRKVDAMRPLLCGIALSCKFRKPVTISDEEDAEPDKQKENEN